MDAGPVPCYLVGCEGVDGGGPPIQSAPRNTGDTYPLGTDVDSVQTLRLPPSDGPAIAADGVGYAYGSINALHQVSFSLARGEFAYLVGPSAAGKTTLMP